MEEEKKQDKKPPIAKPTLICIILLGTMLISVVMFFLGMKEVAATILMILCFVSFISGITMLCIYSHRQKYTCSECGEQREHHQKFLNSSTTTQSGKKNDYRAGRDFIECVKTSYRYKYEHKYVCPNCGKTDQSVVWTDGGFTLQYVDGITIDKRRQIINK